MVYLTSSGSDYDWNSYLVSLYVLFHECAAHGFQSIIPTMGRKTAGDRFTEGWMDFVAFEMMRRCLSGEVIPGQPAPSIDYPTERLEAGRILHGSRHNRNVRGASAMLRARSRSRDAAADFLRLIEQVCSSQRRPSTTAWEIFLEISLWLNVQADQESADVRERFAVAVELCLCARGDKLDVDPPERLIAMAIVMQLIENNDVTSFVKAVLELADKLRSR
jgi:hypothetical protein